MSSNVQQRLTDYSEAPPPSAWRGIADALDSQAGFVKRLHQFEVAPPPAAWQAIESELAAPPARVVSLRSKLFKYAIAAAILAVVAGSSLFYLTHTNGPNLANRSQQELLKANKESGSSPSSSSNAAISPQQTDAATDFLPSATTLAHFAPQVEIVKRKSPTLRPLVVKNGEKTVINTELADRYMIATTQAGTVVRLPKKAYSDYACAETYVNTNCREKIASIQSKMAESVSTDFTDFIYLLQNLQEN